VCENACVSHKHERVCGGVAVFFCAYECGVAAVSWCSCIVCNCGSHSRLWGAIGMHMTHRQARRRNPRDAAMKIGVGDVRTDNAREAMLHKVLFRGSDELYQLGTWDAGVAEVHAVFFGRTSVRDGGQVAAATCRPKLLQQRHGGARVERGASISLNRGWMRRAKPRAKCKFTVHTQTGKGLNKGIR